MSEQKEFFQHLRGEQVESSDPYLQTCAQVIREAMDHPAFYQPAPLTPEKLDAFRVKLRQARSPVAVPMAKARNQWLRSAKWSLPLAASVLLTIGVVRVGMETASNEVAPILIASRSIDGQSVRVVNDPEATLRSLRGQLTALDIESTLTTQAGQWQMEAFVPESKEQQVNQILQPLQISVGNNGSLHIVLRKP